MDLHLNGKTAIVTGSTAGIGLEIARKLAVEGARVIISGRNQTKLDQAVDSIRASGGTRVSGVLADAATEEGAASLVRATPSVDIPSTISGSTRSRNLRRSPTRTGAATSRSRQDRDCLSGLQKL